MMNLKTLYFIPVPDMIYCPEYSCPGFQNPNSICFQCVTENWNIFFKIDWICPFGLSLPQLQWRYNLWVNVNKVWLNCLSIENRIVALRLIYLDTPADPFLLNCHLFDQFMESVRQKCQMSAILDRQEDHTACLGNC